jgi:hypothetical protein
MEKKKEIKKYTFGEKKQEYSQKQKKMVDVWISPKYLETRKKVIEMLEKFSYLEESDFWILMNETKSGKMGYTGLIISHNGCLKINDNAEGKDRFDPTCVKEDKEGYDNTLTFTYCNKEQGIYEIGEVNKNNCKNAYPYAMAYKRLFDRVVLKISKLAFYGVYSDSEAEEFKEPLEEEKTNKPTEKPVSKATEKQIEMLRNLLTEEEISEMLKFYKIEKLEDLSVGQASATIKKRTKKEEEEK